MKSIRLFLLLGIGILLGSQSLSVFAQSDKDKKAEQVKQAIESKRFTIEVDRALPMSTKSISLTPTYTFELKGDSAQSYLPYFGRAYSAPYGGGEGGVKFDTGTTNYTQEFDKKGNATVRFRVKTDEDNYEFYLNIFTNGSTTINVTPVNKQSISYYGQLVLDKPKEYKP